MSEKDVSQIIDDFRSKLPQKYTCDTGQIVSRLENVDLHLPAISADYKIFLAVFSRHLQLIGQQVTAKQFVAAYQEALDDYWLHSKNLHPDKHEIMSRLFFFAFYSLPTKMHRQVWCEYGYTLKWS